MPFIVTINQPGPAEVYPDPADNTTVRGLTVSRVAVTTLKEAGETAREALLLSPGKLDDIATAVHVALHLTKAGGAIEVPGGAVVEVKRVEVIDLVRELGLKIFDPEIQGMDRLLKAYNDRQEASRAL